MKIAITGSTGFIGKALKNVLSKNAELEIIEINASEGLNILDLELLKQKVPAFDVLIHLAAKIFVPNSYETPFDFYNVNVTGTLHALELCKMHNARIIFMSSYVYGQPQKFPISESHSTSPFNPYASSKLLGEDLCKSYAIFHNVPCTILRLFNIYGPLQPNHFLIAKIADAIKNNTKIELQSAKPKRDYVHVNDVVDSIQKSIYYLPTAPITICNIGSGQSYSPLDIINIFKETNSNIQYQFSEQERPNEVMDTVCDNSMAKSILNWTPKVNFKNGLLDLLN
jgi:nucleoside-diphosphate-sugar epimerase